MFDRLVELVHVVSKNKIQRIEIVGDASNYDSLVHRLYRGIQEGRFKTEADAAEALYESSPDNRNFKHLQYILEQRLYNTLFFIDVNKPSFTDTSKAFYRCQNKAAVVRMLFGRAATQSATSLAERTIRKAIEYEFTEIVVDLARMLKSVYSGNYKKRKKFAHYSGVLEKYLDLMQAEIYAEDCYQRMRIHHNASGHIKKESLKESSTYIQRLKRDLPKYHSLRFVMNSYITIVTHYEVAQDYDQMILFCKEAIQKFELDSKRKVNNALSMFNYKLLTCYINTKKYPEAELAAQKCLSYSINGGRNWFAIMENYLVLNLHAQNYQKAYDLLIEALTNKGFKSLFPVRKETWYVYEAYIHYFIRLGKIIPGSENNKVAKKFKYSKFVNEVPIFSKDKRGVNVSILILQILFLLQAKKYDDVIDRTDALNLYCFKYLKKDDSYRSNCFIKMLLKLNEAQFHKAGAMRKANSYLEKLKAHPLEISLQTSEVEIVPYEDLWTLVLDTVDNKFVKTKGR